jgi:hypothetical protein
VIAEPTTTLTDYLLALLGFALAARLRSLAAEAGRSAIALWAASLAAMGVGALLGGTLHGFGPRLGVPVRAALWLATYYAIGLANLGILAGAARAALAGRGRRLLLAALALRFVAYAVLLTSFRDFRYVVYDYALTLALLAALSFARPLRAGAAPWIQAGVAVSFLGALVQRSGLALHPHFNHNDLFHVVQMAGAWLFYRAGRLLRDAGEAPARRARDEGRAG